jgi:hypothetical protein
MRQCEPQCRVGRSPPTHRGIIRALPYLTANLFIGTLFFILTAGAWAAWSGGGHPQPAG